MRTRRLAFPIGLLAALLLAGLLATSGPASASDGSPVSGAGLIYGAAAGTDLSQLPYLEPSVEAGGQSSFNRNQTTGWDRWRDFGHFLGKGPRGNIMLDQQGPGCVYRILMNSLQKYFPNDWVRVYFDGQSKPSIDMSIRRMFSGYNAPFLAPLVDNSLKSSGGWVSYVPLCYRRSIEITTNMDRYYDIGYETYPPNADVKTWTPSDSTAALQQEWDNLTVDPIDTTGNTTESGAVALPPGVPQTLVSIAGSDSIQSIKLTVPGVTASAAAAAATRLNHIWIRIYWDGAATPSVDAPIGSFFAMGQLGSYPVHSLVAGIDASNNLYMYLPMPFRRNAVIQLVDEGPHGIPGIGYQVQYRPFTGDFSQVGYFTTSYTTTSPAAFGRDIPILSTGGSGKLVGVTATYSGDLRRYYLEGDERIYVDGSRAPSFYGSGTEDFFNGGFDFWYGPYSQQLGGNSAHIVTKTADETSAYRFFLQDAIPFRNGIVATIQHGPWDNTHTSAEMLAYYYQRRAVQAVLTDRLSVTDPASEQAHHYVVHGQIWSGTSTYQYEGTANYRNITAGGRGFRYFSQFTMALAADNQGVDLRRMYDQGIANQKARVYVDGRLVGIWYVAGQNIYNRWADSDFLIPAAYTQGKSTIIIRIRYLGGRPYFTEYKYWAYSLVP